MDLEELFPLVSRDALHENFRRTSFVKFVTDGDECLGASSDLLCFSPFWWEYFFEDVGEQRHSLVGRVEHQRGGVACRCCDRMLGPEPSSVWSGLDRARASKPLRVWSRMSRNEGGSSRMLADGSWRSLMKTPSGDETRLAANFARKSAASLSFRRTCCSLIPRNLSSSLCTS